MSDTPNATGQHGLLRPAFAGLPESAKVFSDSSILAHALAFESALGIAMARTGVLPEPSAHIISKTAVSRNFSATELAQRAQLSGNFIVPLVTQLKKLVSEQDPKTATFVHHGTTSQDVLDTALVLTSREANVNIIAMLVDAEQSLYRLVSQHHDTVTVARTLTQQSSSTTYGMRFNNWLQALRHTRTLLTAWNEGAMLQWAGASGTLAASVSSFGPDTTLKIRTELARTLKLNVAETPWHVVGRPFAQLVSIYAEIAALYGTVAENISMLNRQEIAEVSEQLDAGAGGSSAMPHKQNPVRTVLLKSLTHSFPSYVADMFHAAISIDERPDGAWHSEWNTLQRATQDIAAIAFHGSELVRRIEVRPEAVERNLRLTTGRILSERVATALKATVSPAQAEDIMQYAMEESGNFEEKLRKAAKDFFTEKQLDEMLDPSNSVGLAPKTVEAALKTIQSEEQA